MRRCAYRRCAEELGHSRGIQELITGSLRESPIATLLDQPTIRPLVKDMQQFQLDEQPFSDQSGRAGQSGHVGAPEGFLTRGRAVSQSIHHAEEFDRTGRTGERVWMTPSGILRATARHAQASTSSATTTWLHSSTILRSLPSLKTPNRFI